MKRTSAIAMAVATILIAGAANAERAEEIQAPRGEEIQAPRGDQILMPRD